MLSITGALAGTYLYAAINAASPGEAVQYTLSTLASCLVQRIHCCPGPYLTVKERTYVGFRTL